MSNDLNRHQCIGRLGQDPELKQLTGGNAVVNLRVACGNSWKNKQTGQKEERTEWINYVAFGKLAEIMAKYLRKGSKVYLDGELRTRKWQDQSGADRYSTEIVASNMQMLDSRPQQDQQPAAPWPGTQAKQQPAATGADNFDDDIPF